MSISGSTDSGSVSSTSQSNSSTSQSNSSTSQSSSSSTPVIDSVNALSSSIFEERHYETTLLKKTWQGREYFSKNYDYEPRYDYEYEKEFELNNSQEYGEIESFIDYFKKQIFGPFNDEYSFPLPIKTNYRETVRLLKNLERVKKNLKLKEIFSDNEGDKASWDWLKIRDCNRGQDRSQINSYQSDHELARRKEYAAFRKIVYLDVVNCINQHNDRARCSSSSSSSSTIEMKTST